MGKYFSLATATFAVEEEICANSQDALYLKSICDYLV